MWKQKQVPDGRPTISEWPIRIWKEDEIPSQYAAAVHMWLTNPFSDYDFVYAPKRRTNAESYDYLFGYGEDKIIYLRESSGNSTDSLKKEAVLNAIEINKRQITEVGTQRELLNAHNQLNIRAIRIELLIVIDSSGQPVGRRGIREVLQYAV